MSQKRIVMFANERVGANTVKSVLQAGYSIDAVFTSNTTRKSKIADYEDFEPLRAQCGATKFHFIDSPKNPEVIDQVRAYQPDLILVVSWSQIIPQEILDCAPLGTVGIHYSMLPERRGGAPLVWAIIDGLESTGLTLFFYDEGVDTGDIIDQIPVEILTLDTVKTVLDKIIDALPALLLKNLDALLASNSKRVKQDNSKATLTPARKPSDGFINLDFNDQDFYNFVRAQTFPYPGAFLHVIDAKGQKQKLTIPKARITDGKIHIEGIIESLDENESA